MTPVYEYLLKVIICSGVFTGYYWLALRNKTFHRWNRFYLLGSVVISVTIPFVKFTVWKDVAEPAASYQLLQTITTNEQWFHEETITGVPAYDAISTQTLLLIAYTLMSSVMLVLMLAALTKIFKLLRSNPHWKFNGLVFVDTAAKGTPFSFLRYIFWNRKIDFESAEGQQIFAHELVHVHEKHSWDKLFLNSVLVVFWFNPFFWLLKKELTMIHEFIADKKAVAKGDTSAFAAMILAAAFPGQTLPLTNPFFYSPIKRRLLMLSKLNNPKVGYISRLLLLPLLAALFFAFVLKTKEKTTDFNATSLEKEYVVVIDAGHGFRDGKPDGASINNGYSEDEFTLSLAKMIGDANKNEKIKIIFTRPSDAFIPLKERSEFAAKQNADLMISLHASYAPVIKQNNGIKENPASGSEVYISSKNPVFEKETMLLGNAILQELSNIIGPNRGVKKRNQGIWIIDQSICPAILLECGFLTNKKDLLILQDKERQKEMAVAILRGIENFFTQNTSKSMTFDTLPSPQKNPPTINKSVDALILAGNKTDYSQTPASNEVIAEYNTIISRNKAQNKDWFLSINKYISKEDKNRLLYLFLKMNQQQQDSQTVAFITRFPPLEKIRPSKQQFEQWKNARIYGIWINDKRTDNNELNKYKHSDFAHYFSSRLAKNAVNYGKHYVQVNLMTNEYFNDYILKEKELQRKEKYILITRRKS
jgi:N-acetylmuramoyl-L-alanine amidase